MPMEFTPRTNVEQIEEGLDLAPKFDKYGLIAVITTDYTSGEVLMHAYMNRDALQKTIEIGEAHYWSRSRKKLWRKGNTSGLIQHVQQILIDDDQDAIWLRVNVEGGASCHVGYRSCFYREVLTRNKRQNPFLKFTEEEKIFDPEEVYKGKLNPTQL